MFPAVCRDGGGHVAFLIFVEEAVFQLARFPFFFPGGIKRVETALRLHRNVFRRHNGFRVLVGRAVHIFMDRPVFQPDGDGQHIVRFVEFRRGNLPFFLPGADAVVADEFDVLNLLGGIVVLIMDFVFRLEFLAANGANQR